MGGISNQHKQLVAGELYPTRPLSDVWDKIPALLSDGDQNLATVLRKQLNGLARYDMARVSSAQLEALRHQIEATEKPAAGKQLRVALLHHHLRAPSLREELKPFADMSNLEQLRGFLRDRRIAIVIHGHKHEHAAQYEHLYEQDSEAHWKTLVISGSTFEAGRETDAARLISISGMPFNPTIAIEPLPLPRAGVDMKPAPPHQADMERRTFTECARRHTGQRYRRGI